MPATLDDVMREVILLRGEVAKLVGQGQRAGASGGSSSGGGDSGGGPPTDLAPDSDLDGQYGNPEVRKDPSAKYWTGESYVGSKLSDCSPEYLDAFAKYKNACAYANEKGGDASKAKYIDYDLRDARRARGWAARIRAGKVQQKTRSAPASSGAGDQYDDAPPADESDIPF